MDNALTSKEKEFLKLLFKIADVIVEKPVTIELDYEYFSPNDLFNLKEKFGMNDY
mgnify:CR=1 FL=1